MKSHYLCAYHAEKMKACESDALCTWTEMMRHGVQAYLECRTEAARIYLNSALDIAGLRGTCPKNGIFGPIHLTKPAEFLIQLLVIENQFEQAFILLARLSSIKCDRLNDLNDDVARFLASQNHYVEMTKFNCDNNYRPSRQKAGI